MGVGGRAASRSRRAIIRAVFLGQLILVIALIGAGPAHAHAVLSSSDPPAGANLGATPAVVTLVFDEPLVSTLSKATITAPAGKRYTSAVDGKTMTVRLSGNVPGVYRVEWKTVSRVDGHTISGGFEFGVGAAVASTSRAPAPGAGDIAISVVRGIEYALLLLAYGVALLFALDRERRLRLPTPAVAAGLLCAGALVVVAEAVVASSGLSVGGLVDYLGNGITGWARVARVLLEAALLVVALVRRRISPALLLAVTGALAVAGHGADVEPAWQGIAVNAAHLAAAGVWAGGIMALALVGLMGQWSTARSAVLPRFSRVAPWAFGCSVVLGVIQAAQLLGGPGPVLGSSYGLTLVAKGVAIAAMVPLSLLAWRRVRVHVRAEAALALVVVGAAAALSAFPVIPKEAKEAAESAGSAGSAASAGGAAPPRQVAYPQPGDLTMGARAGRVMVGLTLHPGRPGRNVATVYLASPATRSTTATVLVSGHTYPLRSCGGACRTGTVVIRGDQELSVDVSKHGTAGYHLPALPARDGTGMAKEAIAWMNARHTYQVREDLSGIRSHYIYAVPHQLFLRTWYGDGAQDTVWLGKKLYTRARPTAPWVLKDEGTEAPVPYFPWMPFMPLVDVRVVGHVRTGGAPLTVLSAFGGHGKDPEYVWFTLYVDARTHQIVRSQMWATNHSMDDRFLAFDRPAHLPHPGGA